MEEWGRSFENCFECAVENREKISFWDDILVGTEDLRSRFLILFYLSISKDANLAPFGECLNGSWKWDLVWRRGLFDWEKTKELQLLQVLNG